MEQSQGLMHVRARVNGRTVRALVDTGTMHSFMSQGVVHRLGLGALFKLCQVKLVNSKKMESFGQTKATLEVGSWRRSCSMKVLPLDNLNMVLGMDFFINAKAEVMPHREGILIQRCRHPCFVPAEGRCKMAKGWGGAPHH